MKRKIPLMNLAVICCLSILLNSPSAADAFTRLRVKIEVIKAEKDTKMVDPELKGLVKELGPVLSYTGFSLIKKSELNLEPQQEGEVLLSSGRTLRLRFLEFEKYHARLNVEIIKKGKEIFQTTLLLVDKGSVLIGGPPEGKGVLLLRIEGEFK